MKPVDPTTLVPGDIINLYDRNSTELFSQCQFIKVTRSKIITDKVIVQEPFDVFMSHRDLPQALGAIITLGAVHSAVRVLPDPTISTPTSYQWLSYDYYGNARPMTSYQISEYDWTTHQP